MRLLSLACVRAILLTLLSVLTTHADASGGVAASSNVQFSFPQTDEYVYPTGSNYGTYCGLGTTNTWVKLYNGQPNHTYNVDWDMELNVRYPNQLLDYDTATNSPATTDADGKWTHYAHGQSPGCLVGAPWLLIGEYIANASSWISVPGGQPSTYSASQERHFYVAH